MPSALQFYEEAWAGKLELMDVLIAEDHAQRDMVWQVQFLLHDPSSALFPWLLCATVATRYSISETGGHFMYVCYWMSYIYARIATHHNMCGS